MWLALSDVFVQFIALICSSYVSLSFTCKQDSHFTWTLFAVFPRCNLQHEVPGGNGSISTHCHSGVVYYLNSLYLMPLNSGTKWQAIWPWWHNSPLCIASSIFVFFLNVACSLCRKSMIKRELISQPNLLTK